MSTIDFKDGSSRNGPTGVSLLDFLEEGDVGMKRKYMRFPTYNTVDTGNGRPKSVDKLKDKFLS